MWEIRLMRSTSGVLIRSYGRPTKAPPDERGGNRHGRPKTTAPHPDSTESTQLLTGSTNGHNSLRSNSLRIGTGNLIRLCRELIRAIREFFPLIRESRAGRDFTR